MNIDKQDHLRRLYLAANKARERSVARLVKSGMSELRASLEVPLIDLGPFLELRCGARGKRTGLPCPHTGLYANGRCRWHGGLSTGPRSTEGKSRSAMNVSKRWAPLCTEADLGAAPVATPTTATAPMSSKTSEPVVETVAVEVPAELMSRPKPHEAPMKVNVQVAKPLPDSSPAVTREPRNAGSLGIIRQTLQTAGEGGLNVIRIALLTHQSIAAVESTIGLMKLLGQVEDVDRGSRAPSPAALRFRLKK